VSCPAERRQISLDRPGISITRRPGSTIAKRTRLKKRTVPSPIPDRGDARSAAALLLCTCDIPPERTGSAGLSPSLSSAARAHRARRRKKRADDEVEGEGGDERGEGSGAEEAERRQKGARAPIWALARRHSGRQGEGAPLLIYYLIIDLLPGRASDRRDVHGNA